MLFTRIIHDLIVHSPSQHNAGVLQDPKQASSDTHTLLPKVRYANEHSKSPFSFIRVVLFGKRDMGLLWFLKKLLPQLCVGFLLNGLVDLCRIKSGGWWSVRSDTQRVRATGRAWTDQATNADWIVPPRFALFYHPTNPQRALHQQLHAYVGAVLAFVLVFRR